MRLMRLCDVEISPQDEVFSYSRGRAMVVVLGVLGAVAWLVLRAINMNWKPGFYIALAISAFVWLMRRFVTARFRASNWLVRMNNLGIVHSIPFLS
jgi:hypothetical protein